jgi:uncharacterized protein (TIGR03067 family)
MRKGGMRFGTHFVSVPTASPPVRLARSNCLEVSMKTWILMLGSIVTLFGAGDPKTDDAKSEKDKLNGTWKLTAATINGEDKTADLVKHDYVAIIAGDKITLGGEGDMRTSRLVVDTTTQPKRFDILISLGIYELKDDELKVCLGGGTRPTEFTSKAGSQQVLFVFKRAKEKPTDKKPS